MFFAMNIVRRMVVQKLPCTQQGTLLCLSPCPTDLPQEMPEPRIRTAVIASHPPDQEMETIMVAAVL